MPSHSLEQYLEAAQRKNAQRSYASAIRHFEIAWGGLLPATPQSVANYLVAMRYLDGNDAFAQTRIERGLADNVTLQLGHDGR